MDKNLNKIAKYTYKLENSFSTKNLSQSQIYLQHFKYYIQQHGGAVDLTEKFTELDEIFKFIDNEPDKYSLDTLKQTVTNNEKELLKLKYQLTERENFINEKEHIEKQQSELISELNEYYKKINNIMVNINNNNNNDNDNDEFNQIILKITEINQKINLSDLNLNKLFDNLKNTTNDLYKCKNDNKELDKNNKEEKIINEKFKSIMDDIVLATTGETVDEIILKNSHL